MKLNIYGKKRLNIEKYLRKILFLLTLIFNINNILIKTIISISIKKFNLIIYDLLYKSYIIILYLCLKIDLNYNNKFMFQC